MSFGEHNFRRFSFLKIKAILVCGIKTNLLEREQTHIQGLLFIKKLAYYH